MGDELKKSGEVDVKKVYQTLYQILGEKYGLRVTVSNIRKKEEKN